MIAARFAETESEVAAAGALANTGITFTGGLAVFAGTGGLGTPIAIAVEVESAVSLTTAGVLAIAGVAVGVIGDNAENAFNNDLNKVKEIYDDVATDILNYISRYSDDVMNYTYKSGQNTPSNPTTVGEYERLEQLAINNYNHFRSRTDDITKIADNTDWDINDIQKVRIMCFMMIFCFQIELRSFSPIMRCQRHGKDLLVANFMIMTSCF